MNGNNVRYSNLWHYYSSNWPIKARRNSIKNATRTIIRWHKAHLVHFIRFWKAILGYCSWPAVVCRTPLSSVYHSNEFRFTRSSSSFQFPSFHSLLFHSSYFFPYLRVRSSFVPMFCGSFLMHFDVFPFDSIRFDVYFQIHFNFQAQMTDWTHNKQIKHKVNKVPIKVTAIKLKLRRTISIFYWNLIKM